MKRIVYSLLFISVFAFNNAPAQTSVCPAPTGLSSSSVTSNSATVSWNAVPGAYIYIVHYRVYPNTTNSWPYSVTVQANSTTLTSLLSNTTYEWQVQTGCTTGTGNITLSLFSASAFFTTLGGTNICPVPAGLFTNNITNTSARLNWGSTGASGYNARIRRTGTTAWIYYTTSSLFQNVTGLTPVSGYQWQVRSRCVFSTGVIYSNWSATITFQTTGSTNTCPVPTNLTSHVSSTTNGITLHWNATGANYYNIRYRPTTSNIWTNTTSTTNSKTITGLNPTTTYHWQVQGVCYTSSGAVIISSWSVLAYFTTQSPLAVFPNPATTRVMVNYESAQTEDITITIRDFLGSPVLSQKRHAVDGSNQYELSLAGLKVGVYFVEMVNGGSLKTTTLYINPQ